MRVLVTGAKGRLGSQVAALLGAQGHTVTAVDLDDMNITDGGSVMAVFASARPEVVIHCAALTAVDYCAEHPDEALVVNAYGTQSVALACQAHEAALLYISSNEVFDGTQRQGYLEYDRPAPVNPYGYSKWVGEQMVRELLPRHYIVRTAWLFAHGGSNFVHTILRRAGEGQPLRVVTNEVSSPTYASDLSAALAALIQTGRYGTYHLSNEGAASRFAFARAVLDRAGFDAVPIQPIALAEYPRPSRPPEYTVLRNDAAARLGITLRPWQDALAAFLDAERAGAPRA